MFTSNQLWDGFPRVLFEAMTYMEGKIISNNGGSQATILTELRKRVMTIIFYLISLELLC